MRWLRKIFRRSPNKLLAEAEQALQLLNEPAGPVAKLCRECRWYKRSHLDDSSRIFGRCVSPSQPDYNDLAGSEDWKFAGNVRKHSCKGKWWLRK